MKMPPKLATAGRKHLSVSEKLEVIAHFHKTKCSVRKLAKHFNIGKTQAGHIVKQQDKLLELWYSNEEIKHSNLRPDSVGFLIDKHVYQWYKDRKNENLSVTGPMIQNKALEIAKELGNEEFKASNGWLERFRIRHKIIPKRKHGKEVISNLDDWKRKLDSVLATYAPENIFSAVETGLFFRSFPEETSYLVNESLSGKDLSDQRFTILFCISMAGSKEKPLVVAKFPANKPQEICDLPLNCEFNDMAILTGNIVIKWLKDFDAKMVEQSRKVVLFLSDAFSAYELQFTMTEIVYFPTCLFSGQQTFNQGVIQNFKIIYRQLLLKRLIEFKERDETGAQESVIEISDAIDLVETAWKELSESVIPRCFEELGFTSDVPISVSDNEAFLNDVSNLLYAYDSSVNAIDYVSVDADLVTMASEGNDPELIEVLMDGNEMRAILMKEEDEDKKSKSFLPNVYQSEEMDTVYEVVTYDLPCSGENNAKSNNVPSITSYSEALLYLNGLEQFYLSQNDSNGTILVNQLIVHNKKTVNEQ